MKIKIRIIIIIKRGNPYCKSEVVYHQFYTTCNIARINKRLFRTFSQYRHYNNNGNNHNRAEGYSLWHGRALAEGCSLWHGKDIMECCWFVICGFRELTPTAYRFITMTMILRSITILVNIIIIIMVH